MALFVTTDERRTLEEALAHPADDAPRLVLADMLQARGEPFGEFIALQVRVAAAAVKWDTWAWNLAGGAFGARDWPLARLLDAVAKGERDAGGVPLELVIQKRRLLELEAGANAWLRELVPVPMLDATFRRGLPAELTVSAAALLSARAPLPFPLEGLVVTDAAVDLSSLVLHPWLETVTRFTVRCADPVPLPTPFSRERPRLRQLGLELLVPMAPGTLATVLRSGAVATVEELTVPALEWSSDDEHAVTSLATEALRRLDIDAPHTVDQSGRAVPRTLAALFDRPRFERIQVDDIELATRARFLAFIDDWPTWLDVGVALVERHGLGLPEHTPSVPAPRRAPWRRFF